MFARIHGTASKGSGERRIGRIAVVAITSIGLLSAVAMVPHHGNISKALAADNTPAFVVNGQTESLGFWKEALVVAQTFAATGASNASSTTTTAIRDQTLQGVTEVLAAVQAAQAAGVTVSDQEIDASVAQTRSQLTAQPEGAALIQRIEQSLGLTDDQYWAYMRPVYARDLLVGKFKAQYYDNLGAISMTEKAQKWDAYAHGLADAAAVTITDPTDVQ